MKTKSVKLFLKLNIKRKSEESKTHLHYFDFPNFIRELLGVRVY